jgi:hypothetical protein
MSIESKRIEFPSGIWFAESLEALTDSLFAPGGTASGWYEKRKGGILFRRGNGEPWFFLVANKYAERFFVSCGKQSDGRTFYSYALASVDEKALGMPASYSALNEIAESVWKGFSEPKRDRKEMRPCDYVVNVPVGIDVRELHPVIMVAIAAGGVFPEDYADVFRLTKCPEGSAAAWSLELV